MPMDSQDSLSTCEGFVDDGLGRQIKQGYYLNPRDPTMVEIIIIKLFQYY